jgi:hypothetical protein
LPPPRVRRSRRDPIGELDAPWWVKVLLRFAVIAAVIGVIYLLGR